MLNYICKIIKFNVYFQLGELHSTTLETTEATVYIQATTPTLTLQTTWSPTECMPGWSSIINSTRTEIGDFERIQDLVNEGRLPCSPEHITDIDCLFIRYNQRYVIHLG